MGKSCIDHRNILMKRHKDRPFITIAWVTAFLLLGRLPAFGEQHIVYAGWNASNQRVDFELAGLAAESAVLLYTDADSAANLKKADWKLAARGTGNLLFDDGTLSGTSPGEVKNGFRFYALGGEGGTVRRPVYAFRIVTLHPGKQWVGLWGIPPDPTLSGLLGKDLPAEKTMGDASRVTWFARTTGEQPREEMWLYQGREERDWRWSNMRPDTANTVKVEQGDGLQIEIPSGAERQELPLLLRLHRNSYPQEIKAPGMIQIISLNVAAALHPSKLGLIKAGFTGGPNPLLSDWLWTYDREGQHANPAIWYRSSDGTWRFTSDGYPEVPRGYLKPEEAVLLYTRASTESFPWRAPRPSR